MTEELNKHGLNISGAVSTKRRMLISRLHDVLKLRWLRLVLAFPGAGPASLLEPDRIVTDVLHAEMRVDEKLIHLLASTALEYRDKEQRVEAFEAVSPVARALTLTLTRTRTRTPTPTPTPTLTH